MMEMCAMRYFLLLSLAVFAELQADLLMEVKPLDIIVGLTRQLSINCSFIRTDITTMVKLISLVITRSNETDSQRFYYQASVDVFDGLNNVTGDVSGLIDNRHESYITLTWYSPRSTLIGAYSCEANGENLHGQVVTVTKMAEVTATKPDVENLLDVLEQQSYILESQSSLLKLQSSQLTKLQEDLGQISSSVNEKCICCERFNKSLKSKYAISGLHNGSRYYLSPASWILVMKEAEAQCELLGGYLTEVDSEDEYLFIKNFLVAYQDYEIIYTGGHDEDLENNWVNTYSKSPVKYIKWAQGQPNEGTSGNCLTFWRDQGWTMADNKCFQGVSQYMAGYLCEVSE
ncbi:unnamed protein product [Lymnaea stagnalis]|uniref:C-type lectin domain-containing protein n=1 Tax=Lymnaea stagnalis TaxID=6523 RepID=A0AAV2IP15_LYMST